MLCLYPHSQTLVCSKVTWRACHRPRGPASQGSESVGLAWVWEASMWGWGSWTTCPQDTKQLKSQLNWPTHCTLYQFYFILGKWLKEIPPSELLNTLPRHLALISYHTQDPKPSCRRWQWCPSPCLLIQPSLSAPAVGSFHTRSQLMILWCFCLRTFFLTNKSLLSPQVLCVCVCITNAPTFQGIL